MKSLKEQAKVGLLWTLSERFGVQLIDFIVSVVLARILLPEEFGMVAMIAVFVAIGSTLKEGGLTLSLIRTENPGETDYSTVFFATLGLGIVMYWVLFVTAPLISEFFDQSQLASLVRVLGLKIILDAASSIQSARLTKAMNFKTQVIVQIPSVLLSGLLGIVLAYSGFGVWSLVYMNLARVTMAALQLWIISDWRPRLVFDSQKFRTHFRFGYKLTLSGLLDTIYLHIYSLIIGKYFSPAQLGYYTRADSAKQLPITNISAALNKVTYPLMAAIQNDTNRLKNVYKRLMQQVLFWVAPLLTGAAILAEPAFRLLFTEKWLPAAPYFQVLCIVGIMYPLQAYNLNILLVKGRSDLFMRLEIIKKVFVTIGVLAIFPFGIMGLLYFQVASSFITYFVNSHFSGRLIGYGVWDQIRDVTSIFGMTALMGIGCFLLDAYLESIQMGDILRILVNATTGGFIYLGIAGLTRSEAFSEFKTIVLNSK